MPAPAQEASCPGAWRSTIRTDSPWPANSYASDRPTTPAPRIKQSSATRGTPEGLNRTQVARRTPRKTGAICLLGSNTDSTRWAVVKRQLASPASLGPDTDAESRSGNEQQSGDERSLSKKTLPRPLFECSRNLIDPPTWSL